MCRATGDWRVRPLVVCVKVWAAGENINCARDGTISSYSLALMLIHYLQCGWGGGEQTVHYLVREFNYDLFMFYQQYPNVYFHISSYINGIQEFK